MEFSIVNWNIGGAKYLEIKSKYERARFRERLNSALKLILQQPGSGNSPDIVALQEVVRYRTPGSSEMEDLVDDIEGYEYCPVTLVDTRPASPKVKWKKVMKDSDWQEGIYFAQGNAFLFRKDAPLFPVCDLSDLQQPPPATKKGLLVEHVHLESGLYFGDRDTEPRGALVAHFIYDPARYSASPGSTGKPLDVFVVNLHLTTLIEERDGFSKITPKASQIRQSQLKIVFDGIISRYNSWRQSGYCQRGKRVEPEPTETFDRHSPVWILAGDFNFTPDSEEYAFVEERGFIDTIPVQNRTSPSGTGTKSKKLERKPALTVDYVFAGPKAVFRESVIGDQVLAQNRVIHDDMFQVSDHYPLVATFSLEPVSES